MKTKTHQKLKETVASQRTIIAQQEKTNLTKDATIAYLTRQLTVKQVVRLMINIVS